MPFDSKAPLAENENIEMTLPGQTVADARRNKNPQDCSLSGMLRWLNAWEHIINQPSLSFEEACKRRLFTILILPGILILLSFAAYHLSHATIVEGIFDLVAGIWLLFTLVAFRLIDNGAVIYRINAVMLGCLFLFLSIKGGVQGNKLMWVFSFPLIAFYTLGKKEGLIFSAILYILISGFLYLPVNLVFVSSYESEFKVRFCVAFFLVSSLTYIYESVRERTQSNLEEERSRQETEKFKLAELSAALQEANQALSISEERLKRAQIIARVGNLEYGIASGLLWGSEEALSILGIDIQAAEFPLSFVEKIIPDFAAFRREFEECMRSNQEYDRELTIHRLSDGLKVVVHAKAEIVRDEIRHAKKIIGVIQDVSDRKQAERDKRLLEDKLARSQKMESLGLLAGGVAHDLNNVLSGVVGYPDLLLRNLSAESPLTKPLQKIRESGQKAAAIVQDLLTLARRGVANHTVLNFNDLVLDFMASSELVEIQNWHTGVSFETDLDNMLLNIKGSAVHLRKTVINLVSNAAEALPAGGRVWIRTVNRHIDVSVQNSIDVPEGDYVLFEVEDNGIGISSEDFARIFEPFYTKKKMGRSGTGLGMSVVWGTVQDHQGHIQLESSEGAGTRIALYFPVTHEPAPEPDRVIPVDEYTGSGEKILVVDDVPDQRELAQNMLSRLGYKVYEVASGEAALDFLSGQSVDLVILDMIMDPGIDGLETYIRILASHPGQRAIIASGFSENERVLEAQRLGAKLYVKKPYTLEKLGIAVRKALSRYSRVSNAAAPE